MKSSFEWLLIVDLVVSGYDGYLKISRDFLNISKLSKYRKKYPDIWV